MSDHKRRLYSLFEEALQIKSASDLTAFLDRSCGDDLKLRQRLELLLRADENAGRLLSQPHAEVKASPVPDSLGKNLTATLNPVGARSKAEDQVVVIRNTNQSVLRTLCQTVDLPHVMLRDSVDNAGELIVRPTSAEMPHGDPGSRYRLDGEIARGGDGGDSERARHRFRA